MPFRSLYQKVASVTLDIEKGDILLGGRFKNIPMTVEEFGTDENGQPTVNGRKLLAYRIKKQMPKTASVTSAIAPVTDVTSNIDMFFKNPKSIREKSLSNRLTDIVDAEDALDNEPQHGALRNIGAGALAGGALMGTKGILMAGVNPAAAAGFTMLGAGIGGAVGGLKHLLYATTKRKRDATARQTLEQSYNFDRAILDDPEIRAEVDKYRKAKYGPLFGAEGGATLGSLAGAVYKAHGASAEGPKAKLLGYEIPMSQAKAEAAGTGGLYGGLAGLGIGLAAGYGYRMYRRHALRNLLRKKLMKKTAGLTTYNYSDDTETAVDSTMEAFRRSGVLRQPWTGILGHGGGDTAGYRIGGHYADPGTQKNWVAKGVTPLARVIDNTELRNAKRIMFNSCNADGCDIPGRLVDAGVNYERLVHGTPGRYNNDQATTQALAWAETQDRPWLFPTSKEFEAESNQGSMGSARAEIRPYVEPKYWIPGVAIAGTAGLIWYMLHKKNKKDTKDDMSKTAEADTRPYRDRVELVALKDGKVFGGKYLGDKSFGMFGGGMDEEDELTAAGREFEEEAGYKAKNLQKLPIDPVTVEWLPPYKSDKQAERAKKFRGSRTRWVLGDVGDQLPGKALDASSMKDIRGYSLDEIEPLLSQPIEGDEMAPVRTARLTAIREALKLRAQAIAAKTASIWLKDNKGPVTEIDGGRPKSSSNRWMMSGQDVEHYAAGTFQNRYPFQRPTEQPEQYAAGSRVKGTKVTKRAEEILVGGEADGKSAKEYPAKEVMKGAIHETEHTRDARQAVEITKDHLEEDKNYYTKLEKIEPETKTAGLVNSASKAFSWGMDQIAKPAAQIANQSTKTLPNWKPAGTWSKTIKPFQSQFQIPAGLPAKVYGKTPTDVPALSDMANDLMKRTTSGWSDMRTRAMNVANNTVGRLSPGWAASLGSSVGMASQVAPAIQAKQDAAAATQVPDAATSVSETDMRAGPNVIDYRKVASVKEAAMTLRERAEAIVYNDNGILGIKKSGYLLMPGGGLNPDESPEKAVQREALEEADRKLADLKKTDQVNVAYIGEGPSKGFDGERTHFFTARDNGTTGTKHEDYEDFQVIPFEDALVFLTECLVDEDQAWAFDNNLARIKAIESVMPEHVAEQLELADAEIVRADTIKQADVASFLPKSEFVLFNADGKLVVQKGKNRRFNLPNMGSGAPAPYEKPVQFLPPEGVPEPGAHGYEIGLRVGETDKVPEGYEAVDPDAALKDMYASMGMSANRPYQSLDRARARAIVRYLKKKRKAQNVPTSIV